ncbi:MAG: hypothetical protein KAS32_07450 [Candidatus Peribacteraceae bacterium]|nr:hypothetical protein [Candidatus Peribacteraceae bacterium]
MSFEGAFSFAIVVGAGIALFTKIGSKITNYFLDNKGFLGLQIVGWGAVIILFTQSRKIADYLLVTYSEVQFTAIILAVILIFVFVFRYKSQTASTARAGYKAGRTTKRKVKPKRS